MVTEKQTASITADEAHTLLGGSKVLSRSSWYNAIRRNEVPHIRLGKRILIPRHAFNRWLEAAGQPMSGTAA